MSSGKGTPWISAISRALTTRSAPRVRDDTRPPGRTRPFRQRQHAPSPRASKIALKRSGFNRSLSRHARAARLPASRRVTGQQGPRRRCRKSFNDNTFQRSAAAADDLHRRRLDTHRPASSSTTAALPGALGRRRHRHFQRLTQLQQFRARCAGTTLICRIMPPGCSKSPRPTGQRPFDSNSSPRNVFPRYFSRTAGR